MAAARNHETLAAAYVAASAELANITKDRTATVPTKSGASYSYAYASLDTVAEQVRPILARHGLAVAQDPRGSEDGTLLECWTTIWHSSGESWTLGPVRFPYGRTAQEYGSAVTYARRYGLLAALGIAGEEDDDGRRSQEAVTSAPAPPRARASRPARPDENPAMVSAAQVKYLHGLYPKAGLQSDEERLAWLSEFTDRAITSTKDLTRQEASEAINRLQHDAERYDQDTDRGETS